MKWSQFEKQKVQVGQSGHQDSWLRSSLRCDGRQLIHQVALQLVRNQRFSILAQPAHATVHIVLIV